MFVSQYSERPNPLIKYRRAMLSLALINLAYQLIVLSLLYINRNEFNGGVPNLIVSLDIRFDVLQVFIVMLSFVNMLILVNLYRLKSIESKSKRKFAGTYIGYIVLNLIFVRTYFFNSSYGYVAKDEILIKNAIIGAKTYKISDIKYADISVERRGPSRNYYINYRISFNSGTSLDLRHYDSCTYEDLALITHNLEENGVTIKRGKLSKETAEKIKDWSTGYKYSKSFRYILGIE